MKTESKVIVSGLKVVGVMALLASLLLLLPAASAGSYSMTLAVVPDPSSASVGDEVEFVYTIENTGDNTLYNIVVDGIGEDPATISSMGMDEEMVVYGTYTVDSDDVVNVGGHDYVFNDATLTAENSRGRTVVVSFASCPIMFVV